MSYIGTAKARIISRSAKLHLFGDNDVNILKMQDIDDICGKITTSAVKVGKHSVQFQYLDSTNIEIRKGQEKFEV